MAEIPKNVLLAVEADIEPKVRLLLQHRIPLETVLLASIAVSLRRIAHATEEKNKI